MLKSMYSGVAGLRTHQQKMDVVANNIANVNTNGFKASRTIFQESMYQSVNGAAAGNGTLGGKNPSQVGFGSQLGSIDILFTQGNYQPTGNPTDCMIDGGGFFVVGPKIDAGVTNNAVGIGSVYLTRVGNFKIDGDGYLVDSNRNVAYGWPATLDPATGSIDVAAGDRGRLTPLRFPQTIDGAPIDMEKVDNLKIDENGNVTFMYNDSLRVLGRVAVANVQNPNAMVKQQGPYFKAGQNCGAISGLDSGEAGGSIKTEGLEAANVDLANEFTEMITTQRGFQANTRIITVSDEMLQELCNLKR